MESELFEVKSLYNSLCPGNGLSFPCKGIWKVKAPLKVAFFTWTAALGKILTLDNLRCCQVLVVEWCYMCKKIGISVDHMLLHCEYACEWSFVFCLFGVQWVMPSRLTCLLVGGGVLRQPAWVLCYLECCSCVSYVDFMERNN